MPDDFWDDSYFTAPDTKPEDIDPNKVSLDIYKKSQSDGKLAVWMFAMPSENEHTGDCILLRSP